MLKLKEIEKRFPNAHRSDNGQKLHIQCCYVGDNGYNYGERPYADVDFSLAPELEDDPRIQIIPCEQCCGCSDW